MWLWVSYLYALHKHQYHNAKDKRISGTLFYKKKKSRTLREAFVYNELTKLQSEKLS